MPDQPQSVSEFLQTDRGQEFQVELAGLSDAEQANVVHALQDAADTGVLADLNLDHTVLEAQSAEASRAEAQAHQDAQARAADAGDWETARNEAQQAEYAMQDVRDHGGNVADAEVNQTQSDVANLDNANWQQQIADDNATTAQAYAAEGDADHTAQYADVAAAHAETAADYGSAGSAGGAYADHTVDTSSTYDASASAASVVDTSAHVDASAAVDTSSAVSE